MSTAKEWYIEGKYLGIYSDINTTDPIRIHFILVPTALSADASEADAALEDYEDGLVYYACWDKARKLAAMAKKEEDKKMYVALISYYYKLWKEVKEECSQEGGLQELGEDAILVEPDSYA